MGICSWVCTEIIAQSRRCSVEMQTALTLPVAMLSWKASTKFAAGKCEEWIFPLSPYHPCSCPVPPWVFYCYYDPSWVLAPLLKNPHPSKVSRENGTKDPCLVSQLQSPVVICCILSCDSKCSPLSYSVPAVRAWTGPAPQQRDQALCSMGWLCLHVWSFHGEDPFSQEV